MKMNWGRVAIVAQLLLLLSALETFVHQIQIVFVREGVLMIAEGYLSVKVVMIYEARKVL